MHPNPGFLFCSCTFKIFVIYCDNKKEVRLDGFLTDTGRIFMYIKHRNTALAYRCLILFACSVGLTLNLFIRSGQFDAESLIYYTNLSNLICWMYYILFVVQSIRYRNKNTITLLPRLKGGLTLMIAITILVYHFVLAGGEFPLYTGVQFQRWLANTLLHYVTPAMIILDWILFDPKRVFHKIDPLLWVSLPLLYVLFTLVRAEIGGVIRGRDSRFPYFFLDIDVIGWSGLMKYVGIITIAFIAIGYVIVLLDRYVFGKAKSN